VVIYAPLVFGAALIVGACFFGTTGADFGWTVGLGIVLGVGRLGFALVSGFSLGGSFGAVLTFHSGLTFGIPPDRVAVKLRMSLSKKMSNEMFGIWTV